MSSPSLWLRRFCRIGAVTLPLLAALAAGVWLWFGWPTPRAAAPMTQAAYVWQRAWGDGVRHAVESQANEYACLLVLGAEIRWGKQGPRTNWSDVDWSMFRGQPVGVVLRAGPLPGKKLADGRAHLERLRVDARTMVERAQAGGAQAAEVQLDFDAATSQLGDYALWLRTLKADLAPLPLTVTTLPAWLGHSGFAAVAEAADGFVLQVHSLERPRDGQPVAPLCEAARAKAWIERAARPLVSAMILAKEDRSRWGWGCPPKTEQAPGAVWRWLDILDATGMAAREDAAALAWFAYQSGDYDRAGKMAKDSRAPMCAWIRAKLLLREGKAAEAERELETAIHGFKTELDDLLADRNQRRLRNAGLAGEVFVDLAAIWDGRGERCLAANQWTQALTWFFKAGSVDKVRYLSERILTCEELEAWVTARPEKMLPLPACVKTSHIGMSADEQERKAYDDQEALRALRAMLGYRLVRSGRAGESAVFFPEEPAYWESGFSSHGGFPSSGIGSRQNAHDYARVLGIAKDPARPRQERAEAWWEAAVLATAVHGQSLPLSYSEVVNPELRCDAVEIARKGCASPEERDRLARHPYAEAYRHIALDHAFASCALLENNSDLLALRLWTAGKWVATFDPASADRFYKTLVRRCGKTAFGRDADLRRWFPPNPPGQAQPPIRRKPAPVASVWKQRLNRHPWLAGGCVLLLLFAVGAPLWLAVRRRRPVKTLSSTA